MNPDLADRIITVAKQYFGPDQFRGYFNGDPLQLGKSSLPAFIVETDNVDIDAEYTGLDEMSETIVIKIVLDAKRDTGTSEFEDVTQQRIKQLIYAVDSTGAFANQTLMRLIRTNFTLSNLTVGQKVSIQMGVQPRPNDMLTREGHITVTVDRQVQIGARV